MREACGSDSGEDGEPAEGSEQGRDLTELLRFLSSLRMQALKRGRPKRHLCMGARGCSWKGEHKGAEWTVEGPSGGAGWGGGGDLAAAFYTCVLFEQTRLSSSP